MDILKDKKILCVDDEQDVLDTIGDFLDICELDTARDFDTAVDLLSKHAYDAAILDIMGVKGYALLKLTRKKKIPTLMLTAHALSPDNFVESMKGGAQAYVPKDKMAEIAVFLSDILKAREQGDKENKWFLRLEKFFERKFGPQWKQEADPEFWKKYFYI